MTFSEVTHTTFCNFCSFQLIVNIEILDLPEKTCSNTPDKRQNLRSASFRIFGCAEDFRQIGLAYTTTATEAKQP